MSVVVEEVWDEQNECQTGRGSNKLIKSKEERTREFSPNINTDERSLEKVPQIAESGDIKEEATGNEHIQEAVSDSHNKSEQEPLQESIEDCSQRSEPELLQEPVEGAHNNSECVVSRDSVVNVFHKPKSKPVKESPNSTLSNNDSCATNKKAVRLKSHRKTQELIDDDPTEDGEPALLEFWEAPTQKDEIKVSLVNLELFRNKQSTLTFKNLYLNSKKMSLRKERILTKSTRNSLVKPKKAEKSFRIGSINVRVKDRLFVSCRSQTNLHVKLKFLID